MDKTLQDLVWSVLPKEFKEEVKRLYTKFYNEKPHSDCSYGYLGLLIKLFGVHNLTSDAEGEEKLTVEANLVKELYQRAKEIEEESKRIYSPLVAAKYRGVQRAIEDLFGSKCLPDNVASKVASKVASDDPKPAEPKFRVGEEVKWRNKIVRIEDIIYEYECFEYIVVTHNDKFRLMESSLEPYTEPRNKDSEFIRAESVKEARIADEETYLRNLSQETANCDKEFDNILKGGFREHNRLHIAAMIMASMMQNAKWGDKYSHIATISCAAADALIIEVEKTNNP